MMLDFGIEAKFSGISNGIVYILNFLIPLYLSIFIHCLQYVVKYCTVFSKLNLCTFYYLLILIYGWSVLGVLASEATLPSKVQPGYFSGQRLVWKTSLWRSPSLCAEAAHCWQSAWGEQV